MHVLSTLSHRRSGRRGVFFRARMCAHDDVDEGEHVVGAELLATQCAQDHGTEQGVGGGIEPGTGRDAHRPRQSEHQGSGEDLGA